MRSLFVLILVFVLIGCAANQQPLAYTSPSGKPTVTLYNTTIDEARSKIIDKCIQHGRNIEEQGSSVICWQQIQGGDAVLAQLLVGNSHSTPVTEHAQFIFTKQANGIVRIVGNRQWIQSQMVFGQINQQELRSNNHQNRLYYFLNSIY